MSDAGQSTWRAYLMTLGCVILAILALFHRDASKMAEIWWTSSTYTHCLFIGPLVGWLIWQRRDEVMRLTPRYWTPGLAIVAVAAFGWMIGAAAGVSLIRHASLIMMIQASVMALLGPAVARGLMFPLFYLFFLVPFGEELVPPMQTITAKLAMIFLGWAGIPAHIEGVFISLPTGNFEVAEACSGVKFLVAMLAYATLVTNVCYRSWVRRALFLIMALVVPILANGVRAYGTMHIAYRSSNAFAEGIDHVIYGWFFFALVMALVMAIGWRFFDRRLDDPWLSKGVTSTVVTPRAVTLAVPAVLIAIVAAPLLWQAALVSWGRAALPNRIALPQIAGWTQHPPGLSWKPRFDGADHQLQGDYNDSAGHRVTLSVALYAYQDEGKEIVGYAQGAADPDSHWSWANDTPPPPAGRAERIFAPGLAREVASFYVVGGMTTGSAQTVKLVTLKSRLLARDQAAVAVLVSAEDREDQPSRPAIDAFLAAMGPPAALANLLVKTARGK